MIPGVPRRSVTYTAAELDDLDGVKASFATTTDDVALVAADYDGAGVVNAGATWGKGLPRTVTISRADSAGSYTTDPIVLSGTWRGEAKTEELTPESEDGDDVLRGAQLWDAPPAIAIVAQQDTSGAFTIGTGDIGAPSGGTFCGVEVAAEGTINPEYEGDCVDSIFVPGSLIGFAKALAPQRFRTSADLDAPTTVGLTVYLQ